MIAERIIETSYNVFVEILMTLATGGIWLMVRGDTGGYHHH
jgi:hypothetical protein